MALLNFQASETLCRTCNGMKVINGRRCPACMPRAFTPRWPLYDGEYDEDDEYHWAFGLSEEDICGFTPGDQ